MLNNIIHFSCSVMSDSCYPVNRSMPGLPGHHQFPESTQTHVHLVKAMVFPVVIYGCDRAQKN